MWLIIFYDVIDDLVFLLRSDRTHTHTSATESADFLAFYPGPRGVNQLSRILVIKQATEQQTNDDESNKKPFHCLSMEMRACDIWSFEPNGRPITTMYANHFNQNRLKMPVLTS